MQKTLIACGLACVCIVVVAFGLSNLLRPSADDASFSAASYDSFAISGHSWRSGAVTRTKDGDTIVVEGVTYRLAGIDTPESKQPFGDAASGFVGTVCSGRRVHLEVIGEDRYKRMLAVVYVDGRPASLNAELVHAGLAWRYKTEKNEWLEALEKDARERRAGLWASESPIAPWDWRKGVR